MSIEQNVSMKDLMRRVDKDRYSETKRDYMRQIGGNLRAQWRQMLGDMPRGYEHLVADKIAEIWAGQFPDMIRRLEEYTGVHIDGIRIGKTDYETIRFYDKGKDRRFQRRRILKL